ncbi:MAG: hypothetical protein HC911_03720 [Chloroflexaceae bacterium]|nr:hypothetical protein [Chloroflexaceae bacterium]
MEALSNAPGIFIGLIGWAATALILLEVRGVNFWQRRFLIVSAWMLWMVPAFDAVVYQGLLPADMAMQYGAMMTGLVLFVVSLSVFTHGTRSK